MSGTTTLTTVEVEEVVGRIGADLAATAGVQMIHLGIRTGPWKAMEVAGPLTASEVATRWGVAGPTPGIG